MLDIVVMLFHILKSYMPAELKWSVVAKYIDMFAWTCCLGTVIYCVFWTLRCAALRCALPRHLCTPLLDMAYTLCWPVCNAGVGRHAAAAVLAWQRRRTGCLLRAATSGEMWAAGWLAQASAGRLPPFPPQQAPSP